MTLNESIKKQQERFDRHFQEVNIAPERLVLGSSEAVKDFLSSAIREVVKEVLNEIDEQRPAWKLQCEEDKGFNEYFDAMSIILSEMDKILNDK